MTCTGGGSNQCTRCSAWYKTLSTNPGSCADTVLRASIDGGVWTIRNAGDPGGLPIPDEIAIYTIGTGCTRGSCGDAYSKTCWQGQTGDCGSYSANDYSGCYRTVCTWQAANAICAYYGLKQPSRTNLNFFGESWPLGLGGTDTSDLGQKYHNSGQGNFCDRNTEHTDGVVWSKCDRRTVCIGGSDNVCDAFRIWTETSQQFRSKYRGDTVLSKLLKKYEQYYYSPVGTTEGTASVRCVER